MEEKKLAESIDRMNDILERKSNAWRVFLSGVITGIGTAVGAALIGAIIVGAIASSIENIPILRDVVPENVQEYIGNSN
jgi:hypothetical protein